MKSDASFFNRIIFFDEFVFHVSGKVNKQNILFGALKARTQLNNINIIARKVTVLCAMYKTQVIRPYNFETPTMNRSSYKNLLLNYFVSMLPIFT